MFGGAAQSAKCSFALHRREEDWVSIALGTQSGWILRLDVAGVLAAEGRRRMISSSDILGSSSFQAPGAAKL